MKATILGRVMCSLFLLIPVSVFGSIAQRGMLPTKKYKELFDHVARQDSYELKLMYERLLKTYEIDLGKKNEKQDTLLHVASKNGFAEVVAFLLDIGAKTNVRGEVHQTPLHDAVYARDAKVVELLLKNGSDADAQTSGGIHLFIWLLFLALRRSLHYWSSMERIST